MTEMTLLQTRVPGALAARFRQTAKARGKSPYALLAELVGQSLSPAPAAEGWAEHRQWLRGQMKHALPGNACVAARKGEDR